MSDQSSEARFAAAVSASENGLEAQAIEILRSLLSDDPDHAAAHALLALCLIDAKRLHAAEHEAKLALALAPEEILGRLALAQLALARRRLKEARELFLGLLETEPDLGAAQVGLARVHELADRRDEAEQLLRRAVEANPEDIHALVALGHLRLGRGDAAGAESIARSALAASAESSEALVLMGRVLLRRGATAEARDHARSALGADPSDQGALGLLAAVKARESVFLGLWWRWNAWMGEFGQTRTILVLLGAFAIYRVGLILLNEAGRPLAASLLSYVWLVFCVYTWVGPAIFRRSLQNELAGVRLDERF